MDVNTLKLKLNASPGEEKTLYNIWPDQEHSPGSRRICVKVYNQQKTKYRPSHSPNLEVNILKLKLNYFPGEEKNLYNIWPDQEHSPGGRRICVKVYNQEKTSE